jgi:hypothetical protein
VISMRLVTEALIARNVQMPKPILKFMGQFYTITRVADDIVATLELSDARFEQLVDSVISNAQAIKKQVQSHGGLASATKIGHVPTVLGQLQEISSAVSVLTRRLPKG